MEKGKSRKKTTPHHQHHHHHHHNHHQSKVTTGRELINPSNERANESSLSNIPTMESSMKWDWIEKWRQDAAQYTYEQGRKSKQSDQFLTSISSSKDPTTSTTEKTGYKSSQSVVTKSRRKVSPFLPTTKHSKKSKNPRTYSLLVENISGSLTLSDLKTLFPGATSILVSLSDPDERHRRQEGASTGRNESPARLSNNSAIQNGQDGSPQDVSKILITYDRKEDAEEMYLRFQGLIIRGRTLMVTRSS